MKRNQGNHVQFPGHYRHDVLLRKMSEADLTPKTVAELSEGEVSEDTVSRAISGDCRTLTKLWVIASVVARFIKFEFSELFNFDRPDSELDRAVFTRKAVRSSGPARVGARRPAP